MGLLSALRRAATHVYHSLVGPSPYGHVPVQPTQYRVNQLDKDGKIVAFPSEGLPFERIVWVSRHGLNERGVTCPLCNELAVKPGTFSTALGDFPSVAMTSRGEAVSCPGCKVMLMASPNDDEGDPEPGSPLLNPAIHYCFVRPKGASAVPKPAAKRISSAPIGLQTWVVIQKWSRAINGVKQVLNDEEGRVVKLGDMPSASPDKIPAALVAVNGNEGLAGSHEMGGDLEWIPLDQLRAMILPSLRTNDHVLITKGMYEGVEGDIASSSQGAVRVTIRIGEGIKTVTVPIEYIVKPEPLEIYPAAVPAEASPQKASAP